MPGGLDGFQLVCWKLLHRELFQRMATSGATSTWQSLTSEWLQDQRQGLMFSSIFIASLDDDMECNLWRALCYTESFSPEAASWVSKLDQ